MDILNQNIKFYFKMSSNDDAFNQTTIHCGCYKIEDLNKVIKEHNFNEMYTTENEYPSEMSFIMIT